MKISKWGFSFWYFSKQDKIKKTFQNGPKVFQSSFKIGHPAKYMNFQPLFSFFSSKVPKMLLGLFVATIITISPSSFHLLHLSHNLLKPCIISVLHSKYPKLNNHPHHLVPFITFATHHQTWASHQTHLHTYKSHQSVHPYISFTITRSLPTSATPPSFTFLLS